VGDVDAGDAQLLLDAPDEEFTADFPDDTGCRGFFLRRKSAVIREIR
jgi:hypothetical protein